MVNISNEMRNYFENLEKKAEECYKLADRARAQGKDPELKVEIPLAEDMASRVEQIIEVPISKYIRELLSQKIDRETVAIMVAKKVAEQYRDNREYAINKAVRAGLAILTEGILVAPLEGITEIKIGRNEDSSEYLAIYFSGPIRSAGGTAQAMSVLIADIVRKEFGIGAYNATLEEIERYKEEIQLYSHEEHLQYVPTSEEIETVVKNCKVCIDGEGTIEREISGYRNLPRVQTNRIRGGMCLVLAEGIVLKSRKIKGVVDKLKIEGWEFLEKIIKKGDEKVNVEPSEKFIEDVVGGRPVFSHPSAVGGFRLRYGRSRTGGLATVEINPATMIILDDFIAIGTQLKLERPGKAGGVTVCDSIEGPIVLLKNGDLIQINTVSDAKKYKDQIVRIIDVGEILIGVGEFLENNHPIIPSSFNEDWWKEEIISKGIPYTNNMDFDYIWELAVKKGVPLHPKYTLFWHDVQVSDISFLRDYLVENSTFKNNTLFIKKDAKIKNILIELCALHKETDFYEIKELGKALIYSLGLEIRDSKIYKVRESVDNDPMKYINDLASVKIYPRALSRIGARMGRPEKAAERKMDPPVHALFPIGDTPHHKRSIKNAAESNDNNGEVEIKIGIRKCPQCNSYTTSAVCQKCKVLTEFVRPEIKKLQIDEVWENAKNNLGLDESPEVKGVKGLISKEFLSENLEKGILRAIHNVFVYKDGTIRFDMSDLAMTHFKPIEIGLTLSKAYELGYSKDYKGQDLVSENQICNLKVQDLVISRSGGEYIKKVGDFIDDLLVRYYRLPAFYNFKDLNDVIGTLVMGLSPHTSGAVLARVIGFTDAHVCFAHPFFHAAKRRNCDGDEDSILLLLDGLINFSRHFLPSTRGALMDAPLLLSTRINPTEIDKEALNVEIMDHYPLEFYRESMEYKNPKEISKYIKTIKTIIDDDPFDGYMFSNSTENINDGVIDSAYKTLANMQEKTDAQLNLAVKIRAVDAQDVASRVINSHFIPDIMGNLRKFGTQTFRCSKCNTIYRRIPLNGKCKKCGGTIILTTYKGGIEKYLKTTKSIAENFSVPLYTKQRIALLESSINSIFSETEELKESNKNIKRLEDFI